MAGGVERPFKTINAAAKLAVAGDEVLVAPGIYREYVNPVNAGTAEQPIVYRSTEMKGAIITGAEVLTGWEPYTGDVWVAKVDNSMFGRIIPTPPWCAATGISPPPCGTRAPYT